MSETERRYNEMASKQAYELISKLPKAEPKPETCPYCGSANLTHHHIPLERTAMMVFCDDCGQEWDKG